MPWCPKCRYEYRSGFTVCADCGADLVAELPPQQLEWRMEQNISLANPQMVHVFNDETQLGMLRGLLEIHDIPFTVQDSHSAGGYLQVSMGKSVYGGALFVSEQNAAAARELIDGYLSKSVEKHPEQVRKISKCKSLQNRKKYTTRGTQGRANPSSLREWEEQEYAPAPQKGIGRSFERRKKVMRIIILLFALPVVISILLLPLRACSALLSNLL